MKPLSKNESLENKKKNTSFPKTGETKMKVKGSDEKFSFNRQMKTKDDYSKMHLKGETHYPIMRNGKKMYSLHKD